MVTSYSTTFATNAPMAVRSAPLLTYAQPVFRIKLWSMVHVSIIFLSLTKFFNAPKVPQAISCTHKLNVLGQLAVHKVCVTFAVLTLISAFNAKRVMWVTGEYAQILVLPNLLQPQRELAWSAKPHALNAVKQAINALSVKLMCSLCSNWTPRKMSALTNAPMEQLWGGMIRTSATHVRLSASRVRKQNPHAIHVTIIKWLLRICSYWKILA